MKQITIRLTILSLVIFSVSCGDDFLSPAPISSIRTNAFYNTVDELQTGVINMYDGIQGVNGTAITTSGLNYGIQLEYQITEMRSDNTETKSSEGEPAQFERYTIEPTNGIIANYYSSYYNVIFRANTVLANLGVAGTQAGRIEGEAKFVRAYAYFNLVRLFGDIPLVQSIITRDDPSTFARVPVAEVYNLIVSDLTTAVANLDNTYKTRASKAAAQGLLAKVYLTLGNHAEAKSLCEAIINDGSFSLQAKFQDVFYEERNSEIIFAIGFIGDDNNDSQNFSVEMTANGRSSGLNYVTEDLRNAFTAAGDQVRVAVTYRQDLAQTEKYQLAKFVSNGLSNLGVAATSSDLRRAGNDWIVLRYADVLLMHVESILGTANSTTDTEAIASFQLVRNRAGLTDAVTTITKQELLNERRLELAGENHRFFDLVRFGQATAVLSAFAAIGGNTFDPTDILLPIPQREIGLSRGALTQNPGY